jgi:hypothetical protein
MKLVSFTELMGMPEGTIFQGYEEHVLQEPRIFGGPIGEVDFCEACLLPQASFASFWYDPTIFEKWGISKEDLVINYPSNFGRNGLFLTKSLFLVWEETDCKKMAEWLLDIELRLKEQNGDPKALVKVSK